VTSGECLLPTLPRLVAGHYRARMRIVLSKSGTRGSIAVDDGTLSGVVFPKGGKWDVVSDDGGRGSVTVTKRSDGQLRCGAVKWSDYEPPKAEEGPDLSELTRTVAFLRDEVVGLTEQIEAVRAASRSQFDQLAAELATLREEPAGE